VQPIAPSDPVATIAPVERARSIRIQVPRWVQLVLLPLALLLLWSVAGTVRHVLFLLLVALLIALLLNPIVRAFGKAWIPRGVAIALVYLSFAAALALATVLLATIVVQQTKTASHRVDRYFTIVSGRPARTGAEQDLARFQAWLDRNRLSGVHVQRQGDKFLHTVGLKDVQKYTTRAVSWAEGAGVAVVTLLFDAFLVVVVSIYMLLDVQRWSEASDRRFPPRSGSSGLIARMEQAVASYVRGQLLLSLIVGVSVGLGLYILDLVGLFPQGGKYAAAFGAWAGITELIPYIGPWLGAIPPVLYALVQNPISALWVTLLFVGIQQLEGHVIVPNVMGRSLRLHPLLVIFGLLAGGEIYGFPGILVALPLLAAGKAAWEFFHERLEFESWTDGKPLQDVEVELEPPPSDSPPATV
jgi:predicted PurR-regulated permease PerM